MVAQIGHKDFLLVTGKRINFLIFLIISGIHIRRLFKSVFQSTKKKEKNP